MYLARFVHCSFYTTSDDYETELDKIQDQFQDPFYLRIFIKSRESVKQVLGEDDPSRRKMYTYDHGSLLCLYGIRFGNTSIIITGAGIKLVVTMQASPALKLEQDKLNYLKEWLQNKNITGRTEF